jgi:cobaltochelatase CobS
MTTATITTTDFIVLAGNVPATAGAPYMQVGIKKADLFAGRFNIFPTRDSIEYGSDDFKPVGRKNGQALNPNLQGMYFDLMSEANKNFNLYREQMTVGKPTGHSDEYVEGLRSIMKDQEAELDAMRERLKVTAVPAGKSSAEVELERVLKELEALKASQPKKPLVHEQYDTILKLLKKKHAVYIYGPAGTGKSHMGMMITEELFGDKSKFYYMSSLADQFAITGYEDAGGVYRPSTFYKAFKYGGLILIDELDNSASEAVTALNTALSQKFYDFPSVGFTEAHPDFRIITAGNTIGRGATAEYISRQPLDLSSLDRFKFVHVTYSPAIENLLAKGDEELLQFIRDIRQTAVAEEFSLLATYRAIDGIKDLSEDFPLEDAIEMSLFKGIARDDIKMLLKNMNTPATNKYLKACKKLV